MLHSNEIDLLALQPRLKIKTLEGKQKVYDPIRKNWYVLQQEEMVRQLVLLYITSVMKYPSKTIGVEKQLKIDGLRKRFDIVIFNREGKPFILVETKSPDTKITTDTALQIATYNKILRSKYLWISNGHQNLFFKMSYETNEAEKVKFLPPYSKELK